jgi:hypothetical protein
MKATTDALFPKLDIKFLRHIRTFIQEKPKSQISFLVMGRSRISKNICILMAS